ncbi:MAG: phosphoglycerate dehydrogenase [Oscillospiraceae bacterium]|nr:phosphoglycerate dehydrogenase [Oscillospiraceae bacterium]
MDKNTNKNYKVLVTPTSVNPNAKSPTMARLRAFAGELTFNPTGRPLGGRALSELLRGRDGVVAGLDDYSGDVIRECAATGLKVISRYGSGYDNVDIGAARECGVAVCYTPGANAEAVADLAFGLMLCAARRLPMLDRRTKAGEWARSIGTELYGKTIGIVGLGAVGKGVARRALGFSMRVLAYDTMLDLDFMRANGIVAVAFGELIAASDFITLHLPLNSSTRHIINGDVLGAVKQGAVLINTARGGLIDEAAAYEALVSGRLGGLGLDAYEQEPPPAASPLFGLDNVVLTPHTGAHTVEATGNLLEMSVANLIDVLSGRPCRNTVKCIT